MPKQSVEDRMHRLANGGCPIHGIPMYQVGHTEVNGKHRFVAECTRADCRVRAYTHEPFGPLVLLPEFEHLLASQGPTRSRSTGH